MEKATQCYAYRKETCWAYRFPDLLSHIYTNKDESMKGDVKLSVTIHRIFMSENTGVT